MRRHLLKVLGLLASVGALAAGGAVILGTGSAIAAILTTIAFGIVLGLLLFSLWSNERRTNRMLRVQERLAVGQADLKKELSRVAYRTEPIRDIAGTVGRVRKGIMSIEEQVADLEPIPRAPEPSGGEMRIGVDPSMGTFTPTSIKAFAPPPPDPGVGPGRYAAVRRDDPQTVDKYAVLLGGGASEPEESPLVIAIAEPQVITRMSNHSRVESAWPESFRADLRAEAAYLIIDDSAFIGGPWFGADSAEGTETYRRLRELIRLANSRQVLTVMVRRLELNNHFTGELADLCRLVLRGDGGDSMQEAVPSVVRFIMDDLKAGDPDR